MLIIFLEITFILLSACAFGEHNENRCKLNNNFMYLNTKSLLQLSLPENLNIVSSVSEDGDYVVPIIPEIKKIPQKIGKNLNICPPSILSMDKTHGSCLVTIED